MSVLQVPEAMKHLNLTSTDDQGQVKDLIEVAEAAITDVCGPLEPTTIIERVTTSGRELALQTTPVLSLTTVEGVLVGDYDPAQLYPNPDSGVVTLATGGCLARGTYTVTYVAGREELPVNLLYAIKELVRDLYEAKNGGSTYEGGAVSVADFSPLVARLLEPYTIPAI